MTREQERARELVALIEGTNLECHMEGKRLIVTSELGAVYSIDPRAEFIHRKDSRRHMDLGDLEMEADNPMFHGPLPDPLDMPDHNEGAIETYRGPLTDYEEESAAELREMRRQETWDRQYERDIDRRAA